MVLFLNFDGVLHPDSVYFEAGRPVLRAAGHSLFEWADVLVTELAAYPAVTLVLSTSWVPLLGLDAARDALPEPLRKRVVGSTWDGETDAAAWMRVSRPDRIRAFVGEHRLQRWLVIDDEAEGWDTSLRHRIVVTKPHLGISEKRARSALQRRLAGDLSAWVRA